MNHVKCIFNAKVPHRVSSNTGIPKRHSVKIEGGTIKQIKHLSKSRASPVDNSLMLAVKKVYPLLVQRHRDNSKIGDQRRNMLCGVQGSKSKTIAGSLRRLLSERKHSLQCVDGLNGKQTVRFRSSSSSLSYDRTVSYDDEDDRDSRSYAQMITAYNESMTTLDNSTHNDRPKSKMNVQLSRTLFKTTSTLSSSAYNFENFTIKENREETSMTDLSYAIDTTIDKSEDVPVEKSIERKDVDVQSPSLTPTSNRRSYANIIADYSSNIDTNIILSKYNKDVSSISAGSSSTRSVTSLEKSRVDRSVSEYVRTSDDSNSKGKVNKQMNTEELDWLRKVDKILNDLKKTTRKVSAKGEKRMSALKENDVLECVTEQAVWVDKSTLTNRRNIHVIATNKIDPPKHPEGETQSHEVRATKSSQNLATSASNTTSSSYDASSSTTRKDWSQIPRNPAVSNTMDPQVELRMVPSGNESIVSVNVEAIAKAMEARNSDSKELSVIVSSNNKTGKSQNEANTYSENAREGYSNYGAMRISISEGSLPVKELELSVNGKPISDVRSIKARTETLDVMTSMDKVEIRVPYSQNELSNVNQHAKSIASKNISSTESVLKLRIATAFDGSFPVLTSGVKKTVQTQPINRAPTTPKARFAHTEGSNVTTKNTSDFLPQAGMNKEQSIPEHPSLSSKVAKKDETSPRVASDTKLEKHETKWSSKVKSKLIGPSNASPSLGAMDIRTGDIDLRLTKMFGNATATRTIDHSSKMSTTSTIEVRKESTQVQSSSTSGNVKKTEPPKDTKGKLTSEKDNIKTLADLINKQSGKSTGGNSSAVPSKPITGPGKGTDGSKTSASGTNKRDTKTADETKKQGFQPYDRSSKSDDQGVSPKWTPWWSSSDTYAKLKKDEGTQKTSATNLAKKQKTEVESRDKMTAKETPQSSEEKTLSAKSPNLSESKRVAKVTEEKKKKQETKESTSASSKVREAEKVLKSSSSIKSENVQITRQDSHSRVGEKSERHSSTSPVKITEEKLNKRNEEGAVLKETRNVTRNEKDKVKVTSKETPKIDEIKSTSVDSKTHIWENGKLIRQKTSYPSVLSTQSNTQTGFKKESSKESPKLVTKQTKSASQMDDIDPKMKDILNSMKPIEKKKDGTLIDYGVKVPSRKKPEKLKARTGTSLESSRIDKEKQQGKESGQAISTISKNKKEVDTVGSSSDIKTSYSVKQINVAKQSPIEYSPKRDDAKGKKVKEDMNLSKSKQETDSKSVKAAETPVKAGSLREKIEKVVEESKERLEKAKDKSRDPLTYKKVASNQEITKEVSPAKEKATNIKNTKSNTGGKEINPDTITLNEITVSESIGDQLFKAMDKSKQCTTSYQNIIKKESSKPRFSNKIPPLSAGKKDSEITKLKVEHKSDDDFREPFEGTITQKPSKSSPGKSAPGAATPLAGTIVRRQPKESEKRKPRDASYKQASNPVQLPVNAAEKADPSVNLLDSKTDKKNDPSGSQDGSSTPSTPVNPSGSKSPKSARSNKINLIKTEQSDKLHSKEGTKQQIIVKSTNESVDPSESQKDLVYSAWLQRTKEKTDDKTP